MSIIICHDMISLVIGMLDVISFRLTHNLTSLDNRTIFQVHEIESDPLFLWEVDAILNSFQDKIDLRSKPFAHSFERAEKSWRIRLPENVAHERTYAKSIRGCIEVDAADGIERDIRKSNKEGSIGADGVVDKSFVWLCDTVPRKRGSARAPIDFLDEKAEGVFG